MFNLAGRVTVVIGETSGIGPAIALGPASAGADLVATSRSQALVEETAAAIEDLSRRPLRVIPDAADCATLVSLQDAMLTDNAVAPGIIPTELNRKILDFPRGREMLRRTPMQRFGTPEEIVSSAFFLGSGDGPLRHRPNSCHQWRLSSQRHESIRVCSLPQAL